MANSVWFVMIIKKNTVMSNIQSFKRKKIFIQPAFQGKFIFWVIVVVILASGVSAALLYFLLTSFFESQSKSAHIILTESWQHLGLAIVIGNLVSLVIGSVVAAIIVLYRSHKVAGPLYRFCRIFEQIGEGRLDDMTQLRKHDELTEVAESIQLMIDKLKQQREHRLQMIKTIQNELEQLDNPEMAVDKIQTIQQTLDSLLLQEK